MDRSKQLCYILHPVLLSDGSIPLTHYLFALHAFFYWIAGIDIETKNVGATWMDGGWDIEADFGGLISADVKHVVQMVRH